MSTEEAIAIVGMACRFPGARDQAEYWANLRAGRDTISHFSHASLLAAGVEPGLAARPDYVPARGVLPDGGDRFDWSFFGYSKAEAARIDPQQRVLLEVASAALDDAAIDPIRFHGWIGTFAGSDVADPPPLKGLTDPSDIAMRLGGYEKDYVATRIAYKLGLRGPALTVQTACSTALVSVHYACQSLLSYECDAALAGGVTLWLPQTTGYLYQEGNILSRDGRCRPFDASATGTVTSNGVGVVALMRLADALRDGYRIVSVIRGSAVNNDGSEKIGFTAPSVTGQSDAIRFAVARADVEPDDIGYVEAHGTGTRIGDPIEMAALTEVFRESTDRTGFCAVGSVKGNIGHTSAAAGVASLIKTALMLEHRILVPTLHVDQVNPALDIENSPFRLSGVYESWDSAGPLLAGVSSFGLGGTNAHAVLESPPRLPRNATARPRPFLLSCAGPEALATAREELACALTESEAPPLDAVAWTLAAGRREHRERLAVVAESTEQVIAALRSQAESVRVTRLPKVAFLFPGQGTLAPGSARAAYRLLPEFREIFDDLAGQAGDRFGVDIAMALEPSTPLEWFDDDQNQHLALFGIGHALAGQLAAWKLEPSALLGSSLGEYMAAATAGDWSPSDALAMVRERGLAVARSPVGAMLTIAAPAAGIAHLLGGDDLNLAVDGPASCVISGSPERVASLRDRLTEVGIPCRILRSLAHPFHSGAMRPAAESLGRAVEEMRPLTRKYGFISTVTGEWANDEARSSDHWMRNLTDTVRLNAALDTLYDAEIDVFVELGPGSSMSRTVREHRRWNPNCLALSLLGSVKDDEQQLLRACAQLWEHGVPVPIESLFEADARQRCSLPAHPMQPFELPRPLNQPSQWPESAREPQQAFSALRWQETEMSVNWPFDVMGLVGAGEAPPADLFADLERTATDLEFAASADSWAAVVDNLADRGTGRPALVLWLPSDMGEHWIDRLDELADQAVKRRVRLLLVGRDVLDPLGKRPPGAIVSWLIRRRRDHHDDAAVLLDIGGGPLPGPPELHADTVMLASRGERWWEWTARSVPAMVDDRSAARVAFVARPELRSAVVGLAKRRIQVAGFAEPIAASVAEPDDQLPEPTPPGSAAGLTGRPELRIALTALCSGLVAHAVARQADLSDGQLITAASLGDRLDPSGRWGRLTEHLTTVLVGEKLLTVEEPGKFRVADDYTGRAETLRAAGAELDELSGVRRLLEHCLDAYPDVLAGHISSVEVLYPDGNDEFLNGCMQDNEIPIDDVEACLVMLRRAVRDFADRRPGRPLRILEIGGGRGMLTWPLLDGWTDRHDVEYCFTDVSPLLVSEAFQRARDSDLRDFQSKVFDLTRDPAKQGLPHGTFDLVLAFNVLHVAPSVPDALATVSRMLHAGGWFCQVELTAAPVWTQLIWGLAPGWWDFDDGLRRSSVHLDTGAWRDALDEAGYERTWITAPREGSDHAIMAGRVPGARSAAEELRRQGGTAGCNTVFYLPGPGDDVVPEPGWTVLTADGDLPGWRGELARRAFDPSPGGAWRHVEVDDLGEDRLAALSVVSTWPASAVSRLTAPELLTSAPGRELTVAQTGSGLPSGTFTEPRLRPVDGFASTPLAEIWCAVLGVSRATAEDDFFELGGESLMALNLVARVRARMGVAPPITTFIERPTFGALTAWLHAESGADSPKAVESGDAPARVRVRDEPSLIVFNESGRGAPLFFVAPVTGSSLCYRELAARIGNGRPCYGLEAPGLHDDKPMPASFEDVARHHIKLIKSIRPQGPYILAGWSIGAMISHEIIRQLAEEGERVPLLIGIDGYVVDTKGLPLGVRPSYLATRLRYDVLTRIPVRRLRGPFGGGLQNGTGPDFLAVSRSNLRAMVRYRPAPADCEALVIKTGLEARVLRRLQSRIAPMYRGRTEIVPASGTHWTVLDHPHLDELARVIRNRLEQHDDAAR